MTMDEAARTRYLRDRVLTATPVQRVVMLYDRLSLDLGRAAASEDLHSCGQHLDHAMTVVSELRASLDLAAGGPAENLAGIYAYLLREIMTARGGQRERLTSARTIVGSLRETWAQVSLPEAKSTTRPGSHAAAGAWVG